MENLFNNQALWNAVGIAVAALIIFVLTTYAAKIGSKNLRMVKFYWGKFEPVAVEAVDQSTDKINVQLEKLTQIPASTWAMIIPSFLLALGDMLEKAAVEPVREVTISDTAK